MISIFGSFDHRLSTLEHAKRPTQVRLLPILNPPTIIEHWYLENYFCGTTPLCVHFLNVNLYADIGGRVYAIALAPPIELSKVDF